MDASWVPGAVVDAEKHDLTEPSRSFLVGMNLLSPSDKPSGDEQTPYPLQLIKAGVLSGSKWVAGLVGAGGTLTGVGTALLAWFSDLGSVERMVILSGAALILSVTAVVVGWVICTDLNARSRIVQERINGRTRVLHDYLSLVAGTIQRPTDSDGHKPTDPGSATSIPMSLAPVAVLANLKVNRHGMGGEHQVLAVGVQNGDTKFLTIGPDGKGATWLSTAGIDQFKF